VINRSDGLTAIGGILTPKRIKALKRAAIGPTPIQKRLIDGAAYRIENPDEAQSLVFSAHGFVSDVPSVPRSRRRRTDMGAFERQCSLGSQRGLTHVPTSVGEDMIVNAACKIACITVMSAEVVTLSI
jgi:hypothetical protein